MPSLSFHLASAEILPVTYSMVRACERVRHRRRSCHPVRLGHRPPLFTLSFVNAHSDSVGNVSDGYTTLLHNSLTSEPSWQVLSFLDVSGPVRCAISELIQSIVVIDDCYRPIVRHSPVLVSLSLTWCLGFTQRALGIVRDFRPTSPSSVLIGSSSHPVSKVMLNCTFSAVAALSVRLGLLVRLGYFRI